MPRSAARRHAPRARHAARRARWRRVVTALGVTVAVLLATGSVSAFVVYQKLNGNITQENVDNLIGGDRPTKVEVPDAPQEPLNILLLGSDERSGKAAENANVAGRRSDTTILLHLAADRQSAVMVSIPRDTMVPIPSCKRPDGTEVAAHTLAMFNSAFSEAGAACTIKTVEKLTNIRIDHHVVVDFGGFKDMVDALGGVKVCVPQDVNDPQSHLVLTKGIHNVHGKQALAYVRTRHALGNGGDIDRISRQQAFLGSMVTKIKSKGSAAPAGPAAVLPRRGHQLDHHRPRPGQPERAAQAGPGRQGHRHQERHLPHRSERALPRRPQPGAAQAEGGRGLERAPAGPGRCRARSPSRPRPPRRPARRWSRRPRTSGSRCSTAPASPVPPRTSPTSCGPPGSSWSRSATRTGRDYPTTLVQHDPAYDESGRTLGASITGSTVSADIRSGRPCG